MFNPFLQNKLLAPQEHNTIRTIDKNKLEFIIMNLALHFLLELYKINDFMWYENAVYCSFTVRWFILTRQSLIKMSDRSFNCFLFAVRRRKLCFFVAVSCARSKHLSPAGYYVVNYKDTLCSFVEALFIFAFSVAHFVSAWGLTNMSNASPSSENTCRAPLKKKNAEDLHPNDLKNAATLWISLVDDDFGVSYFSCVVSRQTTLAVYFMSLVGMIVYAATLSLGHLWVVFITAGALG